MLSSHGWFPHYGKGINKRRTRVLNASSSIRRWLGLIPLQCSNHGYIYAFGPRSCVAKHYMLPKLSSWSGRLVYPLHVSRDCCSRSCLQLMVRRISGLPAKGFREMHPRHTFRSNWWADWPTTRVVWTLKNPQDSPFVVPSSNIRVLECRISAYRETTQQGPLRN